MPLYQVIAPREAPSFGPRTGRQLTPTDLLDSLKPAILPALACPAADLVQARLDYVPDLAAARA
jgi:hypothetical protein